MLDMKLGYDFFNRHVTEVARDLLGKELIFGQTRGIITETEAYRGLDDEASHAFVGRTKRASIMFGEPGIVYVYMIYGMYYCMNIVTEEAGSPAAVLIRGLRLPDRHITGPGKLCKTLGITKEHNGVSIIDHEQMYLREGLKQASYITTPRIGISKATDKLWRFVLTK